MFSNERNVETIAQLIETLKRYIGLQSDFLKLDVIGKVVKILTALVVMAVVLLLLLIMLMYLSFTLVYAMSSGVGLSGSFAIVTGLYLLVLIVFISNRKRLIEKPLVKFFTNILLNN